MATSNDDDGDRGPGMPDRRQFLAGGLGLAALPLLARIAAAAPLSLDPEIPMEIQRNGSQPSMKGPADWFTGTVRVDPLFPAHEPAKASAGSVTFEPGARTAWHTHPLGQALIITAGCGRVQREGGPVEEIRPGDVIWFPPGEKHWHGASPTTAMTHIAIQEQLRASAHLSVSIKGLRIRDSTSKGKFEGIAGMRGPLLTPGVCRSSRPSPRTRSGDQSRFQRFCLFP